jgi:hypothetical protein
LRETNEEQDEVKISLLLNNSIINSFIRLFIELGGKSFSGIYEYGTRGLNRKWIENTTRNAYTQKHIQPRQLKRLPANYSSRRRRR